MPSFFPNPGARLQAALSRFVPPELAGDQEGLRRANLVLFFSVVGLFFGLLFGVFYLLIGHVWGAAIVLTCTAALAGGPWLVRSAGLEWAVNIYALVLVLGFAGLTAIEGGMHGHAVAWLAVLPLCTSILVGDRTCLRWSAICFACMLAFSAVDLTGGTLAPFYAKRWEPLITVAGYLSLTVFMSLVGVTYERGRRRSLRKLQQTMDALSAANNQLQNLNRERSEFLSIAAHDLRTPLSAILGFAQLIELSGSNLSDMQTEALKRILNSSGRMRELLDRFLSVRVIEEGRLEVKVERCDAAELAGNIVENHRMAASAKGISLNYLPHSEAVWVMADRAAVAQILDNLLSNAIKFSPKGRSVALRVSRIVTDQRAAIEVQDSGPGLSEADQAKLYGKFARLSAQPTGGESSTGLGLSIAKRLAQAMNGDLVCRSRAGEGATFSLMLPAVDDVPPVAKPPTAPPPQDEGDQAPVPEYLMKASFAAPFGARAPAPTK